MKHLGKISLIFIFVLLLNSFAYAGDIDKNIAIQVGDYSMSKDGFLAYLRINQMENYAYYYDQYGGDDSYLNDFWGGEYTPDEADSTKKEWQVLENKSYSDFFKNNLTEIVINMLIEANEADTYGVSLSDSEIRVIENVVNNFIEKNSKEDLKTAGITKEGLIEYLKLYALATKVEYSIGADLELNNKIEDYMQSSIYLIGISYTDFTTSGEETEAEESTEAEETESDTNEEFERNDSLAKHTAESIIKALREKAKLDYDQIYKVASEYDEYVYPYEAYYSDKYNLFELPEEIIKASNTLKREGQVYINPVAVEKEPGTYYIRSGDYRSAEFKIGNDIYPPMKRELFVQKIPFEPHSARKLTQEDLDSCDYL